MSGDLPSYLPHAQRSTYCSLPLVNSLLTYCVLETTPGYGKPRFAILLPASLTALVAFITVAYVRVRGSARVSVRR